MSNGKRPFILFMPEGTVLGHVSRSVEVARRLDRGRFDLRFACSGPMAFLPTDAGFDTLPIYTRARTDLIGCLQRGGNAFPGPVVHEYVEAEIRLLESLKPDVVVGDFRPSLSISAKVIGIPLVCIANAIWTNYYAGPFDPPDSLIFTRILGKDICKVLDRVARKFVYRHYAAPFNRERKMRGLPPQQDVRDCMSLGDMTLLPDLPAFAPTANLPAGFRYVGPILCESGFPVLDGLNRQDRSRPTVYLTFGSTGRSRDLPRLAMSLADSEFKFQVICTTGGQRFEMIHPRISAVPYASGRRLCREADIVVCHGGNGTIYQALSEGRPIVGIPSFHDQEFNMQQVVRLGLGVSLKPDGDLLKLLPIAVDRVLRDDRCRERCAQFQKQIAGSNGAEAAAAMIADFASANSAKKHGNTTTQRI